MRKIGIGLSAVFIVAAAAKPGTAQDTSAVASPQYPAACVEYVAEYMGCLNYGDPTEAQANTARSRAATASQAQAPSTTPPAHAVRIVPSSRQ
jgi:hypothetical protein